MRYLDRAHCSALAPKIAGTYEQEEKWAEARRLNEMALEKFPDFHKAIVQSCDVYFYNVGKRLGIDVISTYANELGIGHKTGIDLPGEEAGLMPSEAWE